jgi:DUF4097 and DUF4098 domain-containing protein YvlB
MSDKGMGFGGFLLGLGVGWYVFRYVTADVDMIGYLLILAGAGIIANALLSRGRRRSPIQGLFGGLIGGLFLALFITQGFGIITEITDEFSDVEFGTYRATRSFTLDVPVTAESVDLMIESVNGGIEVSSWAGDNVEFDIEVKARGDTTAEAEANLDMFTHSLEDSVSAATQSISLGFPIASSEWRKYSVTVEAHIPTEVADEIRLQTTNGAITVQEVSLQELFIDTTNGGVSLMDVASSTINAETTNGAITGTVTSASTIFSTTNGKIDMTLGVASGEHRFSTTNGSIDLTLPTDADIGYSVDLDTSVGSIEVNLPNMEYDVDKAREKKGETAGYDAKETRITISADTSIGSINLN